MDGFDGKVGVDNLYYHSSNSSRENMTRRALFKRRTSVVIEQFYFVSKRQHIDFPRRRWTFKRAYARVAKKSTRQLSDRLASNIETPFRGSATSNARIPPISSCKLKKLHSDMITGK